MRTERRAGRIIVTVICIVVIAATVGLAAANLAGIRNYVMQAESMSPAIGKGALCFVNTNTPYDEIVEGDVIAFDTENALGDEITMISRVTAVTEAGLETQGDANEISDGIAADEAGYIGKTVFKIPVLGYVVNVFRGQIARYVAYAALIVLLILVFVLGRGGKDDGYDEYLFKSDADDTPDDGHDGEPDVTAYGTTDDPYADAEEEMYGAIDRSVF